MKELIEKFVKENNLDLTETGSALNSTCCILSGYALHIGVEESISLTTLLNDFDICDDFYIELRRVFEYAQSKNYGNWWDSKEAKKQFKF